MDYKLKLCPKDGIYLCFKFTGCALSSGVIHNSIDPTFPMAKSCAAGEGIYYIHQGQTSFMFLNLYIPKKMICNSYNLYLISDTPQPDAGLFGCTGSLYCKFSLLLNFDFFCVI